MPIDKFAIEKSQAGSGLPRLGKLHKGAEKTQRRRDDGKVVEQVGRDLTYFRMAFAEGYEHLSADFAQMYGTEPTSFPVMFNGDTVHDVLDAWYEEWDGAGTMFHRCTGTHQVVSYNLKTGYYDDKPQACIMPACRCKEVARLELIFPDFIAHTGEMGTITLETHSEADIRTLIARLSSFQANYGTLRGVPMILFRAPKEVSAPKVEKGGKRTGERVKVRRAMIDIKIDPQFAKERLMGALTGAYSSRSLPHAAGVIVSQEETPRALGSGPKRLTTDAPQLPAPVIESEPHWTAIPERWSGFLTWAGHYGYDEADVFTAMEWAVQRDIKTSTDWALDKVAAMAAVIARAASYSADTIKTIHINGITNSDSLNMIRADAKRFAEEWHKIRDEQNAASAMPQPVDTDEIPF